MRRSSNRQFVRPGGWRLYRSAPITTGYVILALGLGGFADHLVDRLGTLVSAMSSASAIAILSAIASGMMAFTAIVFSLLFVAMQLGGTWYSPRLVSVLGKSTFMGHALGIFTGTFVYALMAVRTVDIAGAPGINVPVVVIAFIWLLASIVMVVLLLPHIQGLAIADLLAVLHDRAGVALARVYRPLEEGTSPAWPAPLPPGSQAAVVHSGPPQYLTGIDVPALVRLAGPDALVVVHPAIGDALLTGDVLVSVVGTGPPLDHQRLASALWFDRERSLVNDPAYAIRLLVDIAIRALSPAVNDPTTAVSVLDQIEGILRRWARRALEDNQSRDAGGRVCLVRAVPTWDDILALALTEIHYYGRDSFQVQRRLATLVRDLAVNLPGSRRPAIERFSRWRTDSLAPALNQADAWTDPSACDRQGLGHPPAVIH